MRRKGREGRDGSDGSEGIGLGVVGGGSTVGVSEWWGRATAGALGWDSILGGRRGQGSKGEVQGMVPCWGCLVNHPFKSSSHL